MSPTQHNPARALEYKENGNKSYQAGDYIGAEGLYSKAILWDSTNPSFYVNRAMARLKLKQWDGVITDSLEAIRLKENNMKAWYNLAQAQAAKGEMEAAVESSLRAHKECLREMREGGRGGSSLGSITELVLRCKKDRWDQLEKWRLARQSGVVGEAVRGLELRRDEKIQEVISQGGNDVESTVLEIRKEYDVMIEDLRKAFEQAGVEGARKRTVPDWCIDDITFAIMVDPVVTKTGQSYERSAIMEHLKRSATDPLTREPLRPDELRPNLALKQACEEFLEGNGWAVDW
ncbi:hypothetical protein F5884DRAFT_431352 [Xylogone sp. PMI_703]|nr:hypothetical protein F5884DRAFT_431352 [Xylogone sp. PMI_703]